MSLELVDKSIQYPRRIAENVLIKVDKFALPIDFVILDMREDTRILIILGIPFQTTARAMIDVFNKRITLRVGDEEGKPQHDDKGFVDSGCSRHMTGNISYLSDFKEFDGGYVAFRGGAYGGRITGKGTLKTDNLDFEDILLKIPRKDNMYNFDMKNIVPKESLTCLVAKATLDESMLWHRRLGHINFKNINKLVKDNLVRGLPTKRFENDQTCVACLKGKQHRASCKSKVLNPITKPLFMLHMDLFGPTFVSSLMHKKYCLVVTDDYSRFTWVFFLTTKDETSEILKNFIKEIENLVDLKVKIIRSDNGTEFKNKVMDDFCREKGIKREYSVARTPQQNGVAKRRNRTLIEAARTMLADSKLPTTFWAEAVSTACYVHNRVLVVKPHNKTPYELFRGFKPTLSFMRPFGYHVTILNTLDSLGKFDGKSDEGFFVGYSLSSKAFRVQFLMTLQVEDGPNNENAEQEWFSDDSINTASPNEQDSTKEEPEVDLGNITNSYTVPIDNVIGEVKSTVQTRRITKPTSKQGFLSDVYEQKTHCFLSQIEPTSITRALSDSSWAKQCRKNFCNSNFNRVIDKKKKGDILLVQVYVDDIIFGSTNKELLQQKEDGIFISEDKYVAEILKKFNYSDVKSMIGYLMYLTESRLDIMFVVYACARFQVTPKTSHLLAVKRIFRYLKGKPTLGLWYSRDSLFELVAYTDSDYAGATQDRKSTTRDLLTKGFDAGRHVKRGRDTKIPQSSGPPKKVGDEAVHKELGNKIESYATTTSSLEAELLKLMLLSIQFLLLVYFTAAKLMLGSVNAVRHMLMLPVQVPAAEGFAETHNVVAFLEKPIESDGFTEIIDFLKASSVHYALTVNPIIYTSCIEQFWTTAKVQTVNGVRQLQALVDKKRVIVTESSIRRDLHLDDAEGTDCLPTATIFEELARMGYEKPSQKLTFYKAFFSPQWKYFIHTITQCLSAKSTAWNEFSCSMASLIICLATNQKFNLSKYIFDAMVKHLDGGVKFLMYPRFLQVFINQQLGDMSTHKKIFVNPFHTKKVFANMKRAGKDFSGRITPLFDTMMVQVSEEVGEDSGHPTDSTQVPILDQPSTSSKTKKKQPSKKTQTQEEEVSQAETEHEESVLDLEKAKDGQAKDIAALKKRIQRLERKKMSRPTRLKRLKKVSLSRRVESFEDQESLVAPEDASKQGRSIADIDADVEMPMEAKVDEKDSTTGEAVTIASVEDSAAPTTIEEITLAQTLIQIKAAKPKVVTTTATTTTIIRPKAKRVVVQEPKVPLKRKDQIALDEQIARDIQAKLDAVKGKSFDEIQKLFDKEMKRVNTFMDMVSEEKIRKVQQQESSKKQRIEEDKKSDEVEEVSEDEQGELMKHLVIKKDEDIAIDAIQLATKLLVIIDYKLHKEGMLVHYQLTRADGSSKRYFSMIKMLQGIDKEDLEAL
ncbi:putative ribonuclease H-like domain-containing protein [Tanacetum coccineum]